MEVEEEVPEDSELYGDAENNVVFQNSEEGTGSGESRVVVNPTWEQRKQKFDQMITISKNGGWKCLWKCLWQDCCHK